MREIKFRQPDFLRGKFNGWHYWGFIADGRFDGIQTGTMTIAEAQEKSQQYTGLKDKNGKEIYEGDIIDTHWGKTVIVYDHKFAGFWLKRGSTLICLDDVRPIEVIGNLYENPELIHD